LTPYDPVELRTSNKPKKFHFDKKKRMELTAHEKRAKKLKWLRKLYKDAKNAELIQEQPQIASNIDKNTLEQLYENPFDDKRFLQLEDEEFDDEVNNLIEWCEDLDYEKYIGNWHQLATSAYSGAAQEKYNLTGGSAANNLQMLMMRSGLQGQDLLPGGNITGNTVGISPSGGNLIA
jgi:hypothetical protein